MPALSEKALFGVRCAAEILRNSRKVVVLTGAGISTPSGIPDFRSTDSGLWEHHDPFEVASLTAFRYNPGQFFNWMRSLVGVMIQANPNPAHYSVARLEQAGYIKAVITQNIDALHQRAGSQNVLEVHGSMNTLTCVSCYQRLIHSPISPLYGNGRHSAAGLWRVLKPDLALFGEQPCATWLKAHEATRTAI
jgi:NAD-dependent deacetylase